MEWISFIRYFLSTTCLLYTSDAADEARSVDLGGRRIIKKKKTKYTTRRPTPTHHDNRSNSTH
ncbi:hypothetical protein PVA38_11525 [Streptococcus pneumoniae D39]|nr:hypothetical protein PVA38_11525 [Streptococcus pneumoniae D39]